MNVTTAALDTNVKNVIALSTDKAVNPINLYGATKLCADKLFIAANSYRGKKGIPLLSVVRYGNVLGSRGSLVPQWKSLVEKGATKLPLTSDKMTRFWITIEQTVSFVLSCLEVQLGGEIFVPKIPSIYIKDLAQALFGDIALDLIGIRPGEKIHEILISKDDSMNVFEWNDHFRIMPAFAWQNAFNSLEVLGGKKVPEDFSLSSDTNPMLEHSIEEIRRLLQKK
jgi:UDP-N-acetylglucosamine 4,6-dehydratase